MAEPIHVRLEVLSPAAKRVYIPSVVFVWGMERPMTLHTGTLAGTSTGSTNPRGGRAGGLDKLSFLCLGTCRHAAYSCMRVLYLRSFENLYLIPYLLPVVRFTVRGALQKLARELMKHITWQSSDGRDVPRS